MYPRDLPVLATTAPMPLAIPMLPTEYAQSGMSLSQLIAILWAYRKRSVQIAVGVIALAAVACLLWPRTYEATATLMVNFEVNDPLGGREFPVGLLGSYMSTQVELARGSEVLLPVIDRLQLTKDKRYASGYPGKEAGLRDWVATRLRKNLLVEQGRYGSQLINVTYASDKPVEAAQVANMVAEVYSEQQYKRTTGPASDRAKRYTEQLAELKNKVSRAQEQVTAFRKQSGLVDLSAKTDLDLALLSTLEQRLQEAQNARRAAEARASSDQSLGTQVLASTMVQSLKTQLALQNSRMAQLRTTLGPHHPQIMELQSEINVSRQSLNAEMQAYAGNAREELASARQLEQKLQTAVDAQHASVINVHQQQDDGAKYQLELESAQAVYKRALDGYDQVMFASAGGYTNVNFVSRATPPPKASKPKVSVMMFLACIAGAGLGLVLPLFYELLNRRVRCRDDMERDHGIPVLVELSSTRTPGNSLAGLPA